MCRPRDTESGGRKAGGWPTVPAEMEPSRVAVKIGTEGVRCRLKAGLPVSRVRV